MAASSSDNIYSRETSKNSTVNDSECMQVLIKRPGEDKQGSSFECSISKHATIQQLKQLLEKQHPCRPLQQRQQLVYSGRATKPVIYLVVRGEGTVNKKEATSSSQTDVKRISSNGNQQENCGSHGHLEHQQVSASHSEGNPSQRTTASRTEGIQQTLELQSMLQNYFGQLEVSLREWSRHLEQLADISGAIAAANHNTTEPNSQPTMTGTENEVHPASSERRGAATGTNQGTTQTGERSQDPTALRQVLDRQHVGAPAFQRGFVLQFQIDWQLLMKLVFLVLLVGQNGDPFRFYFLLFFAIIVYLYQTGALSGLVTRVSELLSFTHHSGQSSASGVAYVSRPSDETTRSSRVRRVLRNFYAKMYLFLYSFVCSLFPAWQPDAGERAGQHED
eukprot:jgi/Galph1/2360/GphlegSOOS_G28.1